MRVRNPALVRLVASRRIMLVSGVIATSLAALLMVGARADTKRACLQRTFEGSKFIVCTLDMRRSELRLLWQGASGKALRGFAALANELGNDTQLVEFAMNAGMFDAEGAPIGLFVAGGVASHPLTTDAGQGNFYLKPNGVFAVDQDRTVHVESTDTHAARAAHAAWATQSGPMLVIDGALHPAIAHDGASRTIRNGVGVRDQHTAMFAISEVPVSLGRFARLFRDTLHCRNALYLDGAVSSIWIPGAHRQDSSHALGPMLIVLKSSQAN